MRRKEKPGWTDCAPIFVVAEDGVRWFRYFAAHFRNVVNKAEILTLVSIQEAAFRFLSKHFHRCA